MNLKRRRFTSLLPITFPDLNLNTVVDLTDENSFLEEAAKHVAIGQELLSDIGELQKKAEENTDIKSESIKILKQLCERKTKEKNLLEGIITNDELTKQLYMFTVVMGAKEESEKKDVDVEEISKNPAEGKK